MASSGSDSEEYEDDDFEQQFHFQSQLPNIARQEQNSIPGSTQSARAFDGYIPPLSGKTVDEGENYSNNLIHNVVLHFDEAYSLYRVQ